MKRTVQQGSLLDVSPNKTMLSQSTTEKTMSRLEELIAELCPNGVEYIKLEEVCGFMTGFSFKSSLFRSHFIIPEKVIKIV